MEEQRYLTFKILCHEQKTKTFLAVMLSVSLLTNLVLAVGSCLR